MPLFSLAKQANCQLPEIEENPPKTGYVQHSATLSG